MVRIPKRVGAVKLPRKVRKKAKKAIKAAASPFVRDFATAAMAAAGRARRAGRFAGDQQGKEYSMCTETRINVDGSKVAEAFRTAALDGFRRFLEGFEEGLRKAQDEQAGKDDPQPEPQAAPEPEAQPKAAAGPKAKPRKPRPSRPSPGAAPA